MAELEQVTDQVKELLLACVGELSRSQLMKEVKLTDRVNFRENYLNPALEAELIEMPQPDSPRSPTQKYRLTPLDKPVLVDIKMACNSYCKLHIKLHFSSLNVEIN